MYTAKETMVHSEKGVLIVTSPSSSITRWNIFARELEDILAVHGRKLSHLDDLSVVLHPEKVRRLQQSLKSPGHLTTLNPEEMERLMVRLELTMMEQSRLRAALLATAVERILMDRIDANVALMASNDVFHILFAAMKARPDTGLKHVRAATMLEDRETAYDQFFLDALDLIDRATLALHLCQQTTSSPDRFAHARLAHDTYTRSLALLAQTQLPLPDSDIYRYWHEQAAEGQQQAALFLQTRKEHQEF